jgi:hypothetical protein
MENTGKANDAITLNSLLPRFELEMLQVNADLLTFLREARPS